MFDLSNQAWKNDCAYFIRHSYHTFSTKPFSPLLTLKVGRLDSERPAAIRLSGDKILEEHCHFENVDGKVVIQCLPESITVSVLQLNCEIVDPENPQFINGKQISAGQVCFYM